MIGAPMYNFTIPSQLKAWIDRILYRKRRRSITEDGSADAGHINPGMNCEDRD